MKFPKLRDLDWLKQCALSEKNEELADKLELTYKWILWSRRHAIIGRDRGMTPEYQICFAMSVKYHRMLFDLPISTGEQALIAKAEKRMKA